MSLRHKLFLAFLFIVIIPISLLGMIIIELIITRSDETIANTVAHELAMAQAHYQRQGEELQHSLTQATHMFGGDSSHNGQVNWEQILPNWQQIYPRVDWWLVMDQQGGIVAQFSAQREQPQLYHFSAPPFSPLLEQALTTGDPHISSELLDAAAAQYLVQLVLVPFDANGAAGAIMAIDRLDNNVWSMPPQSGLSYGANSAGAPPLNPFIFVTQHNKIVSASSSEFTAGRPPAPELQNMIDLTVNTSWESAGRSDISAVPHQVAGVPMFDSRHKIIGSFFVGLPYRKYFGLQAQTGWIVTTMLIFSAVISLITASLIASAITQPIQSLIEKSDLLADGDLSVRASVNGKDEIAQLGHAFNKMAARLETSYEELAQEQRRALAIIEASADGIWVVNKQDDGSRKVTIVNSALEHMTRRSREVLVGQRCSGLMGVCTTDGQSICTAVCPFSQPHKKTGIVHGVLPGANGQETPVEISYGRLTNRSGELVGLVHIMRDLTLRREVEQLKAEFISMVSHELRTPLGHIKGFSSTLLQPDVTWDSETQHDFLSSIDREADRLTKLVENLLQMSRIEAGGLQSMEQHLHQVDELLELVLPELHRRANQHNLVIDMPPAAASTPILADTRGLELVLANLVENAAKYSPPYTTITLSTEHKVDTVIFSVQDEGAGIARDDQKYIFDRFYRSKTIHPGVSGTGLGLAICKRIVEAHNGTIWVDSQSEHGACFLFSLPVYNLSEEWHNP